MDRTKRRRLNEESTANASWGLESVKQSRSGCAHFAYQQPLGLSQKVVTKLHPLFDSKANHCFTGFLKNPSLMRLTTSTAPSSGNTKPVEQQNTLTKKLVDQDKLQNLLGLLKSEKFVGVIDPRYHSRFFKPPDIDTSDTISSISLESNDEMKKFFQDFQISNNESSLKLSSRDSLFKINNYSRVDSFKYSSRDSFSVVARSRKRSRSTAHLSSAHLSSAHLADPSD